MESHPYLSALLGGVLIGLAAICLLATHGKIAGISSMIGWLIKAPFTLSPWRAAFLAGLVAGGVLFSLMGFPVFAPLPGRSLGAILLAGFLVGVGTHMGHGCTSGHGVCGVGRLSRRSLIATAAFMISGAAAVWAARVLAGGNV